MARLIDADKLKAHYAWWADAGNADMRDAFDTIVDLQPTVEVEAIEVRAAYEQKAYNKGYADGKAEPTKHGRWKHHQYGNTAGYYECDNCGKINSYKSNYCPNCGARMDAQIGEDKSHPFAESVMMGMDEVENA